MQRRFLRFVRIAPSLIYRFWYEQFVLRKQADLNYRWLHWYWLFARKTAGAGTSQRLDPGSPPRKARSSLTGNRILPGQYISKIRPYRSRRFERAANLCRAYEV